MYYSERVYCNHTIITEVTGEDIYEITAKVYEGDGIPTSLKLLNEYEYPNVGRSEIENLMEIALENAKTYVDYIEHESVEITEECESVEDEIFEE